MKEKEIVDYLRNLQKSAEIEAKINGINIWALLGAAALIAWQLLGSIELWNDVYAELALRTTLCAQALYFLISFTIPSYRRRDEPRYISIFHEDAYTPLTIGIFILVPILLYWNFIGGAPSLILPGIFGCIAIWISLNTIYHWFRKINEYQIDKFPRSDLSLSPVRDHGITIIFIIAFIYGLVSEMRIIISTLSSLPPETGKSLGLVAALYMVTFAIIERRQKNYGISWTYGLETDLLLGLTTAEEALKQIEYRRLGTRLQVVMNNFFKELDQTLEELDRTMETCAEQLVAARLVPSYDDQERITRNLRIASSADTLITNAEIELGKLVKYLDKLDIKYKLDSRSIAPVLRNIRKRQEEYSSNVVQKKRELELLINQSTHEPPTKEPH